MIACIDVDYRSDVAVTACVGIRDWGDANPCVERVRRSQHEAADYIPGEFYRRELPCILDVLATVDDVTVVVVDGYVWLAKNRPGLGAHLHAALGGGVTVVGVAKTPFRDNDAAVALTRGGSDRPLYITAAGIELSAAADAIGRMAGAHRMPAILKRVDRLARDS